MTRYSAADAKNRFGEMLNAAQRAPVVIEKHGRPVGVVMSQEDFEDFQAAKIELLRIEIEKGLAAAREGRTVDGETAMRAIRERLVRAHK
jgi:prevent-host-death family protein